MARAVGARPRARDARRGGRARRARRRARAHGGRRAGCQRRGRQARRAALPERGDVPRACTRVGARRDGRGGQARSSCGACRLPAPALDRHRGRGDRGRVVPGHPPHDPSRRSRARTRHRAARLRGRLGGGRPGALLPRDPRLARARRLGGAGVRRVQHAAPLRDAGDRRARAGAAEQQGHGADAAHGRRVRRQGDAAPRLRGDRRARRHAHRTTGAPAPESHAGPHDDRQAASLPHRVEGRIRRRRPHPRARRHAHLRRRLESRPVGASDGPGAVPRRQRVLDPALRRPRPHREDEQGVADRVPRVRRTAGHLRDRGHPGPRRARPRDRRGDPAGAELLRARADDAVRAAGAPPGAAPRDLEPGARRGGVRRTARPDRRIQRPTPRHETGPRHDARQVRHLVHPDRLQPGRRARARLQGRLGAHQPRRHRDGTGPAHQDAAGRRDRAGRSARGGAPRAHPHRQGAEHLGHCGLVGRRPQRRRREARVRADPAPHGRRGRAHPRHRRARRAVLTRAGVGARCVGPVGDLRRGGGGRLPPASAALGGGLLPHRGPALGRRADAGRAVQVLRLRRRRS